jgi:hypothetical protein
LNTAGEILKEHYDVSIDTIGNPLFQNGKYFYLDPSYSGLQFGLKVTETIGLGGYYFVHGIEDTITPESGWTTSVQAKFHSEPFRDNSSNLSFNRKSNVVEEKPDNKEKDPTASPWSDD